MKELDVLLARYLRERWHQANSTDRALFEQILELPDPLLAAYLLGRERAPDPAMQSMLEQLRGGVDA